VVVVRTACLSYLPALARLNRMPTIFTNAEKRDLKARAQPVSSPTREARSRWDERRLPPQHEALTLHAW